MIIKIVFSRSLFIFVFLIWLSIFHISAAQENHATSNLGPEKNHYLLLSYKGKMAQPGNNDIGFEMGIIIELLQYSDEETLSHLGGTPFQYHENNSLSQSASFWGKDSTDLHNKLKVIFLKSKNTNISKWYEGAGFLKKKELSSADWLAVFNYISANSNRSYSDGETEIRILNFSENDLTPDMKNTTQKDSYRPDIDPKIIRYVLNKSRFQTDGNITDPPGNEYMKPIPPSPEKEPLPDVEVSGSDVDHLMFYNHYLHNYPRNFSQPIGFSQEYNAFLRYVFLNTVESFRDSLTKQYNTITDIKRNSDIIKTKVESFSNFKQPNSVLPESPIDIDSLSKSIAAQLEQTLTSSGQSDSISPLIIYLLLGSILIIWFCHLLLYIKSYRENKTKNNIQDIEQPQKSSNTFDPQIPNQLISISGKIETLTGLFQTTASKRDQPFNSTTGAFQYFEEIMQQFKKEFFQEMSILENRFLQKSRKEVFSQSSKSMSYRASISPLSSKDLKELITRLHSQIFSKISTELNTFSNNMDHTLDQHLNSILDIFTHSHDKIDEGIKSSRQSISGSKTHTNLPVTSPVQKEKQSSLAPSKISSDFVLNPLNKAIEEAKKQLESQNRIRLKEIHPRFFQLDNAIGTIKLLIPPEATNLDIQTQKLISGNTEFNSFIHESNQLFQSWEAIKSPFKIFSESIDSFSKRIHEETEKVLHEIKQTPAPSFNDQIDQYCKKALTDKVQADIRTAQHHKSSINPNELIDITKAIFKLLQRYRGDIESFYNKIPHSSSLPKADVQSTVNNIYQLCDIEVISGVRKGSEYNSKLHKKFGDGENASDHSIPPDTIAYVHLPGYRIRWADRVLEPAAVVVGV